MPNKVEQNNIREKESKEHLTTITGTYHVIGNLWLFANRFHPGWGSNWDTVTGLLKVTALFRNWIATGLHFQNKECIGTWGYFMAGKVTLLTLSD